MVVMVISYVLPMKIAAQCALLLYDLTRPPGSKGSCHAYSPVILFRVVCASIVQASNKYTETMNGVDAADRAGAQWLAVRLDAVPAGCGPYPGVRHHGFHQPGP